MLVAACAALAVLATKSHMEQTLSNIIRQAAGGRKQGRFYSAVSLSTAVDDDAEDRELESALDAARRKLADVRAGHSSGSVVDTPGSASERALADSFAIGDDDDDEMPWEDEEDPLPFSRGSSAMLYSASPS